MSPSDTRVIEYEYTADQLLAIKYYRRYLCGRFGDRLEPYTTGMSPWHADGTEYSGRCTAEGGDEPVITGSATASWYTCLAVSLSLR